MEGSPSYSRLPPQRQCAARALAFELLKVHQGSKCAAQSQVSGYARAREIGIDTDAE